MTREDRNYYEVRAEAELAAAASSANPAAVRAHYLLAGFYLDLVHGEPDGCDEAAQEGDRMGEIPLILGGVADREND